MEIAEALKTRGPFNRVAGGVRAVEGIVPADGDAVNGRIGKAGEGDPVIPADEGVEIIADGISLKARRGIDANLSGARLGRCGESAVIAGVDKTARRPDRIAGPDSLPGGAEDDGVGIEGVDAVVQRIGVDAGSTVDSEIIAADEILQSSAGDAAGALENQSGIGGLILLRRECRYQGEDEQG